MVLKVENVNDDKASRDQIEFFFSQTLMSLFSDGCNFLRSKPDILTALFALTHDPSTAVVKQCYHVFINLSADEAAHQVIGPSRSPNYDKCLRLALTGVTSFLDDIGVG